MFSWFEYNYCDFFEWRSTDKVINVKKILVYRTTNEDYLNSLNSLNIKIIEYNFYMID